MAHSDENYIDENEETIFRDAEGEPDPTFFFTRYDRHDYNGIQLIHQQGELISRLKSEHQDKRVRGFDVEIRLSKTVAQKYEPPNSGQDRMVIKFTPKNVFGTNDRNYFIGITMREEKYKYDIVKLFTTLLDDPENEVEYNFPKSNVEKEQAKIDKEKKIIKDVVIPSVVYKLVTTGGFVKTYDKKGYVILDPSKNPFPSKPGSYFAMGGKRKTKRVLKKSVRKSIKAYRRTKNIRAT